MGALKAAVTIMSVLIVAGMGFLIYGLATGLNKVSVEKSAANSVASEPERPAPAVFGDITVNLPSGARLDNYRIEGDRLILSVSFPDGGTRLTFFDLRTGERLGSVNLNTLSERE